MHFVLPFFFRGTLGLSAPRDEHLLAFADADSVQALGISQPVMAHLKPDMAVLCPDLVHEARVCLSRRY
jgi:hypothetical protein